MTINVSSSQPEDVASPEKTKGSSLHTRIFLGLLFGALLGLGTNVLLGGNATLEWFVKNITEPIGQIFLRLMTMTVVPLVFASLTLGVASLGDLRKLGRIGLKTFAIFVLSMIIAAGIGLTLVNTVKPGVGLSEEVKTKLMATYGEDMKKSLSSVGPVEPTGFSLKGFLNLIPKNPLASAAASEMLPLIFFSLLLGIALTRMPSERARPFLAFLMALGDAMVVIIDLALMMAPYGVFALIFSVSARFGLALIAKLGWYVFVVVLGIAIHQFVVLSAVVSVFARISPIEFYKATKVIMLTAFSTSSSNATLPTTIRIAEEELGVPKEICGFVLPLGATMNMNGTALFEGVTVLFLAQVFGVPLSFSSQLTVLGMSVLSAVGTAGVPGGTIPLLIVLLQTVGVPGEGIALILGVDRFLDMCRTTLNVSGDVVTAAVVARSEGFSLTPHGRPKPIVMEE